MLAGEAPLFAVAAVGTPLAGALLTFVLVPWARTLGRTTAVLTLGAALGLAGGLGGAPVRHALGGWDAPLGIVLHVDPLAALMVLMSAVVAACVSLGIRHDAFVKEPMAWPLWLGLWSGLNALFLSGDLFNVYVTLELVGLTAAALSGLGTAREAHEAALRYLLVSLIGSLCYLMGVALLYRAFGSLDIAALASVIRPTPAAFAALAAMVAGLLLKTALFPFHFWLPPAHANAPAVVSAVLSGLVVKATFYLVLRLWLDLFGGIAPDAFGRLLGALGAAAVVWGSIQALRTPRLKMLVAYSTVAQLGYLFLAFALAEVAAGPELLTAIVVFAIAHAFAKAAMFLAAGAILATLGHDRIAELAGAGRRLGLPLFALGLAGISIVGLPPSGGFAAKWLLLTGAIGAGLWPVAAVLIAGSLLAAGYVMRPLATSFLAQDGAVGGDGPRAAPGAWPALALALGSLALGFASPTILALFGQDAMPPLAVRVDGAP